MSIPVTYTTRDGSTRQAQIGSIPKLSRSLTQLKVRFESANPISLEATGGITALFVGNKGWAQFEPPRGGKRIWKPMTQTKAGKWVGL